MAHGHPDYLDWEGRSGVGLSVGTYSFSFNVGAGATVGIALTAPAAGTKQIHQFVNVSVPDNTSIHRIVLTRAADAWVFFWADFITNGTFDFPGQEIFATTNANLFITNNSAGALTFIGTVAWTDRPV